MACTATMIAALQAENEQLRARLAELEKQTVDEQAATTKGYDPLPVDSEGGHCD